jgi:acyl-CoA synthetase (AMP-forming)/AMP-acid ligase II
MEQSTFVTDWLDKRERLTPDRVGLVDYRTGAETTFRQWNARVNRTAHYLESLGFAKGDRLAVYSGNNPEYVDLFFAAGKLGIILQNLNWRLTVHELEGIVADGEPKVLMYSPEWRENVDALRPSFTTIEHIVAMTGEAGSDRSLAERDGFPSHNPDRPELEMDEYTQ